MNIDEVAWQGCLENLRAAVTASKRQTQVPFPISFVRASAGKPPLARMVATGQGDVRLKLYLCITLRASSPPYNIVRNPLPRVWAAMLGLPDPEQAGARRVKRALTWLAENKLIELNPRNGLPPSVQLLSPSGNGSKYLRPAEAREERRYLGVPLDLWRQGWLVELDVVELALLLVLLELQGGRRKGAPHPCVYPERHEAYGLSEDTWTRGLARWKERGALTVKREFRGDDQHAIRLRNTYWLNKAFLAGPPEWQPIENE